MKCIKCGNEILDGTEVCPDCGAQQKSKPTKFCKHCGEKIDIDCIICPKCGKQVEQLKQEQPNVVINNTNENKNTINGVPVRMRSKWVSLALCFFLGVIGAHKFYEGKNGMGILYLFTFGLFGIGVIVDFISLIFKTNPYYV